MDHITLLEHPVLNSMYCRESAKSRAKTEHININDRYKVIMKPERTLTPVGEREEGGSAPSTASTTLQRPIDVEEVKPATPQPAAPAPMEPSVQSPPEKERPIGPKPAKIVDSSTISTTAFMHFAPKQKSS